MIDGGVRYRKVLMSVGKDCEWKKGSQVDQSRVRRIHTYTQHTIFLGANAGTVAAPSPHPQSTPLPPSRPSPLAVLLIAGG